MGRPPLHAVTGAYGFSGKYIARRLLRKGYRVRTLTHSPRRRNPFGSRVEALPYRFDEPAELKASLEGVRVLYNTYWVRFDGPSFGFASALENTRRLFRAAARAGVARIVHVSITNPSPNSRFPYFRGKAAAEAALVASGVSRAVLRPAVLFGKGGILVNNIAWALRRFPVFAVFGSGDYRLQPIHVDDLARLAVREGEGGADGTLVQAVGRETFTFKDLVRTLGRIIGKPRPLVPVPPVAGAAAGWLIGRLMGDVFITRDEIRGLMAGLLSVDAPPAGRVRLTDWAQTHAHDLGRRYESELARRQDRLESYTELEDPPVAGRNLPPKKEALP